MESSQNSLKKHPLIKRMDQILEKAEKGNEYDYDRIMREIDFRLNKKEKQRQIVFKNKQKEMKFQKKLKEMEEYRQQSIDEKRKKILEKQKNYLTYMTELKEEKKKKLIPIKVYQSHINKAKELEKEFCDNTLKKLEQSLENLTESRNQINKINLEKIKGLSANNDKVYAKKQEIDQQDLEKLENKLSAKQINIVKHFDAYNKELQLKNNAIKRRFNSKSQNVIEKRQELLKQKTEQINNVIQNQKNRKINEQNSQRLKSFVDKFKHLEELQKKNYGDVLERKEIRNDNLNKRHHDFLTIAHENEQNNERIAKTSQNNTLKFNDILREKYESFITDLRDVSEGSIINKSQDERMKIYYKKKKEEKERLEKERDEKLRAEGKL